MVVATCEVGAQDQGEFAGRTGGGERAHFAAAAGAKVAAACGAGVAGAQRRHAINNARGETHHEKGRLDRWLRLGRIIGRERGRRSGSTHQELPVMDFIQGNGVGLGRGQ